MQGKLKTYLIWCAATGKARQDMHVARAALNKEYSFDEWLRQQDSTRQDCISCADAVLPLAGRPVGKEWRYYRHCDFYKFDGFCGVAEGGCPNRARNLKYGDSVARYDLMCKRRRESFKALFRFDRLKAKIAEYQEYKKLKKIEAEKLAELNDVLVRFNALHERIHQVYEMPEPHMEPREWGTKKYPCEVEYRDLSEMDPFVLDYNIAFAGTPTVFRCPNFAIGRSCNASCEYRALNNRYFRRKAEYELKQQAYDQAKTNTLTAWHKFWGRRK